MTKYVILADFGYFLGITSERLVVKKDKDDIAEYPLNRLKCIYITKLGGSISTNLIMACSVRGIPIIILDEFSHHIVGISGEHQHAMTSIRRSQFTLTQDNCLNIAKAITIGKIKNQRAVILYFAKYLMTNSKTAAKAIEIRSIADKMFENIIQIEKINYTVDWRNIVMGYEGISANIYWNTLKKTELLPPSFKNREGRGSIEIINKALNYGYAVLQSQVWLAIIKAGLEPYVGIYHVDHGGREALVLDLIEEYRAWVVDRVIIKMRYILEKETELTQNIKKEIVRNVIETFTKKYVYKKKRLTLSSILQRQVYNLCGTIMQKNTYKPYIFKW